jgi:hypothetical protein
MIGPTKLSAIRTQVRKAFRMSDAELLAWFNRQIEESCREPEKNQSEIDTLQLLRDALVKEAMRPSTRRRVPRVADGPKS